MKTLLFQGDSITDCGRANPGCAGFPSHGLGPGYPGLIAARLWCGQPGVWDVQNRGISGDRIVDLYARWKRDCLNLKPDILSILIGINDIGHEIWHQNGVEKERYIRIYAEILDWTKSVLPQIKIVILEPFAFPQKEEGLKGIDTELFGRIPDLKQMVQEKGALWIPLQKRFDEAIAKSGNIDLWTLDRLHPTLAGHQLIADAFLHDASALLK